MNTDMVGVDCWSFTLTSLYSWRMYTGSGELFVFLRHWLTIFLGAIFGTGTNGAYVEDVSKITKLANSAAAAHGGSMIVNTEWGAFNNSVCNHLSNAILFY